MRNHDLNLLCKINNRFINQLYAELCKTPSIIILGPPRDFMHRPKGTGLETGLEQTSAFTSAYIRSSLYLRNNVVKKVTYCYYRVL